MSSKKNVDTRRKVKEGQKTYFGNKLHHGNLGGIYFLDNRGNKVYVERLVSRKGPTKKEAEKFRKKTKKSFSFDECVDKMKTKGRDEHVSKKICGSIRRKVMGF